MTLMFGSVLLGFLTDLPDSLGASVVMVFFSVWVCTGWWGLISLYRGVTRGFRATVAEIIGVLAGILSAAALLFDGDFKWDNIPSWSWYDYLPFSLVFPVLVGVFLVVVTLLARTNNQPNKTVDTTPDSRSAPSGRVSP